MLVIECLKALSEHITKICSLMLFFFACIRSLIKQNAMEERRGSAGFDALNDVELALSLIDRIV